MVYLDTSVALALFVPEPATPRVEEWFATENEPLAAGDWLVTEFASALAIKERRGDLLADDAAAVWSAFEALCGGGLRLVPVSRSAFRAAAQTVRDAASGLRAGDALHLAVAVEIGAAAVATGDALMTAAAERLGLTVVRF
jgi:hypothetical protein